MNTRRSLLWDVYISYQNIDDRIKPHQNLIKIIRDIG